MFRVAQPERVVGPYGDQPLLLALRPRVDHAGDEMRWYDTPPRPGRVSARLLLEGEAPEDDDVQSRVARRGQPGTVRDDA
jgi:hypothetical protein